MNLNDASALPPAPSTPSVSARLKLIGQWIVQGVKGWFLENWNNTVVDVNHLPRQLRWLTAVSYGAVVLLLLLVLLLDAIGMRLPAISFSLNSFESDLAPFAATIPYAAVAIFSLATILGWALIMTGASDCRRRIFIPVLLLFAWQWILTAPVYTEGFQKTLQRADAILLLLAVLLGLSNLFTRRFAIWTRFPLLEFILWFGFMAAHTVLTWIATPSPAQLAENFNGMAKILTVVAIPYWVWLGIDAGDAAKEYAYFATQRLQMLFSPAMVRRIVPLFLLVEFALVVVGILTGGVDAGLLQIVGGCTFFLLLLMGGLFLIQRWTLTAAVFLFWCGAVAIPFAIINTMFVQEIDINEMLLGAVGIVPSAGLFSALLLYDVASFGTRTANNDSAFLPRSGRLLLYLGVAVLLAGCMIFVFNLREVATGDAAGGFLNFMNMSTTIGLVLLAPFYVLWSGWKSRHDLVLPPATSTLPEATPSLPSTGD